MVTLAPDFTPLRPPFAYFGGKTRLAPRIAALLPEHSHYVEPFAGSLAVLLSKPRATMETVNDLDGDLMTFWRVLRDRPADLARVCALTPHSRAEYESARCAALGEQSDLERARLVWVLLTQGRAGTMRTTGWRYFRDRASSTVGVPAYLAGYVDRIVEAADRLQGVSLEQGDALELIDNYGRNDTTLIYADPPYLTSTRARQGKKYAHELLAPADHRALAELLRDCRGPVVLSGYASPLYDQDLYADWHRVVLATSPDCKRTEVLWANRPLLDDEGLLW